jgi:hypothetical protein
LSPGAGPDLARFWQTVSLTLEGTVTVSLNGADAPVDNRLHTWGDLVASLDTRLARSRHVVTMVRLDGVEEPAFRDPSLCASRLAGFRRIEIETGEPQLLARRSLGEAAAALAELGTATKAAASQFRLGDIAVAEAGLEQVSQSLLMVLRIVAAAGLALRRELESPDRHGMSIGTLTTELGGLLGTLVDAQRNDDWLRIAEVLDGELVPVMARWQQALAAIAGT